MGTSPPRFRCLARGRRSHTTSRHVARIGWLLITLLLDGVVEYHSYTERFAISKREFQRDLKSLREMGLHHGFTVSRTKGGRVFLYAAGVRLRELGAKTANARETIARIAAALGRPVEHEVREAVGIDGADMRKGFLHVREPLPRDGEHVGQVFEFLKEAAAGPARVEFMYTPANGTQAMRRTEPYHVVLRDGRYYLIAYDLARRDWRTFALDAIKRPWRKEGTFTPRSVPERLLAERAVGWIRGTATTDVTIVVSPAVANAVKARVWQRGQDVTPLPNGGAKVVLQVEDVSEAIRWALAFGPDAVVAAPPQAVQLARRIVDRIARSYHEQARSERGALTG
jgi:predicted DNA-binding transcriptional regulator YafY